MTLTRSRPDNPARAKASSARHHAHIRCARGCDQGPSQEAIRDYLLQWLKVFCAVRKRSRGDRRGEEAESTYRARRPPARCLKPTGSKG